LPHDPQWFGSLCSFTQDAAHKLSPGPQPEVHAKGWLALPVVEQSGRPPEQMTVHPPQWAATLNSVSQPLSGFVEQIP
jgi:hypothetical protein